MKWSWRIGSLAGIGIYIHATFPILLAWVALAQYQVARTPEAAIAGVGFVLAVFGIVVLHELGHALAARRFGIATRRITLLPIGGLAEMERIPDEPRQELVIAAAGPAVNVVLALISYALYKLVGGATAPDPTMQLASGIPAQSILATSIWINTSLAVFNLIPAFPLDGGRILRALLAARHGQVRATEIAARFGKGFALLFGIVGFFFNPILLFIALFIWVGATGESKTTHLKSALDAVPVERVMIRDVIALETDDPLARAVEHILDGFQQDFPVLAHGDVVGVLARADLIRALARYGEAAPVWTAMRREFHTVAPTETVGGVYPRFRESQLALPVIRNGELLGLLTLENIAEFVMIQNALSARERAA